MLGLKYIATLAQSSQAPAAPSNASDRNSTNVPQHNPVMTATRHCTLPPTSDNQPQSSSGSNNAEEAEYVMLGTIALPKQQDTFKHSKPLLISHPIKEFGTSSENTSDSVTSGKKSTLKSPLETFKKVLKLSSTAQKRTTETKSAPEKTSTSVPSVTQAAEEQFTPEEDELLFRMDDI